MKNTSICVVGLGYVGLPLLYQFAMSDFANLTGYDISDMVVSRLEDGEDHTGMLPKSVITQHCQTISWQTFCPDVNVYIVCVPTPDHNRKPDYTYVEDAVFNICKRARHGSTIVLESTVGPGTTRQRLSCIVNQSGKSITLCYSPERINPSPHAFLDMTRCTKLLAFDMEPLIDIAAIYREVFDEVLVLRDTRVAELAKCFENSQRCANIAMMNELAVACHREGIDYQDVVKALRTKPGSPRFTSGMVGGHCIPVDPYFLDEWYRNTSPIRSGPTMPELACELNDTYIEYIVKLILTVPCVEPRNVLLIGASYKPDVKDMRNAGANSILKRLPFFERISLYDPIVGLPIEDEQTTPFNIVVGCTNHSIMRGRPLSDFVSLTIDCTIIDACGFDEVQLRDHSNIIRL